MTQGSMFLEFDNVQPIGRARVHNQYARCYPGVRRNQWYPVIRYGERFGLFIDLDGHPRYVVTEHFEVQS